jgi:Ni/Co efflux regulator RcnB
MKLNVLVSSVLGVALAGLMVTAAQSPAAAQDRSNKGGQDAGNVGDERAAQVHAANQSKKKKDKDRNPAASTNKTKGMHKAKGHSH